jgi:putative ABC transport system permease protein
LRQFGGIDQMKEVHRDDRSVRWLENLIKDARYGPGIARARTALRDHRGRRAGTRHRRQYRDLQPRRRGVAEAASLPQPERVVRMWEKPPTGTNSTTALNFTEMKRRLRTFEAFSAEVDVNATAEIGGEPVRLQGRRVSANHFAVFGIAPMLGRTFREKKIGRARKRARDQPRGVATALRRRSQHSRPRSRLDGVRSA